MSMNYRRTGLPGLLQGVDNTYGYLKVFLTDSFGKSRMYTVHSLVMLAFVGPRPYRMDINHRNGIKSDNRVENLHYCTTAENMQLLHASGKGNPARGERHPSAKLTDEKAKEIHRLRRMQFTYVEIAKMLDCDKNAVARVASGKAWKHVLPDVEA